MKEEENVLKEEIKASNKKPSELTVDELAQVAGGIYGPDPGFVGVSHVNNETGLILPVAVRPEGYDCSGVVS